MSQVHKVINLKEPFRIFTMTVGQLGISAVGLLSAFFVGTNVPSDWKIHNMPAGFVVGLVVFCLSLVAGRMTELKPMVWWRNSILYRLKLIPSQFIPKPEEPVLYPDPTIIEKGQAEEFYVESSSRRES